MPVRIAASLLAGLLMGPGVELTSAQWTASPDREHPAIAYRTTPPEDAVAVLQRQMASRTVRLERDRRYGYLPAVLRTLNIPVSSQTLVFSRTSLQKARISPATPRAIYFNDHTYVAFVPGGAVLEVASVDPRQGVMFYTLDQAGAAPRIQRQTGACLECHDTRAATGGVPGLLMKSHYTTATGEVLAPAGTYGEPAPGPFAARWGGWFVTGTTGTAPHMGNAFAVRGPRGPLLDRQAVALGELPATVEDRYPSRHSDVAALLVLEHQVRTQNLMTRLGYRTRMAQDFDRAQRARRPGSSSDIPDEATRAYVTREAEPLVRALLRADDAPLTGAVAGSSTFARDYAVAGASAGRPCAHLDLAARLSRLACSPLLYAPAFAALPDLARRVVLARLSEILASTDIPDGYPMLSTRMRAETRELLRRTLPAFAAADKP